MDQLLTMAPQVTAVSAACNYHLRRLSSLRCYLTTEAARTAVQALITSRLDYCNSLFINISAVHLERLQRLQNKAARLVSRVSSREHVTPILQQLHWLPIHCRAPYKILLMVFKCIHGLAPRYLSQLITTRQRDGLRHSDAVLLHQPMTNKCVGEQAFGVAAPRLWNALPSEIRSAATLGDFKTALKTHMFKLHFD